LTGRPDRTITRADLSNEYGASQADIDKVIETFRKYDLEIVESDPGTRTVRLRGSISAMENAFQVKLFNYSHDTHSYRGRVGPVHVPVACKDIAEGVFGLDNRQVAHRKQVGSHRNPQFSSVQSSWYLPNELAKHYNFPDGDGAGQAVALLEFGGGYFEDDLKQFCDLANISTPPKVIPISVDGISTNSNDDATGEVMLDIEVVAGVCPKSNIVVYFARWGEQGWLRALDSAIHDQRNDPGVISISWGYAEDVDIWTRQAMNQVNEALAEAARIGVTVCVATGDDGSSDGEPDGHAHTDFPSSSPYVLAVGGTAIPSKGSTQPDIVWMEGSGIRRTVGGSTGGGVSAVFSRPEWQKDITIESVNPGAIIGRCIPDLAANADANASPYTIVVGGQAHGYGGTSASSPLVAGLLTLINASRPPSKRVGYLTPILYQNNDSGSTTVGQSVCTDVQSGNNNTDQLGGYDAGLGYDAASGWGTPDGRKLARAIP